LARRQLKREPTMVQAGVYGSIMHYLAAINATGTTDGPTVVKQMKATPVNDFMTKNGKIREDGTLVVVSESFCKKPLRRMVMVCG
jgi:branched-chain amino acid transport system substrate-binding protein